MPDEQPKARKKWWRSKFFVFIALLAIGCSIFVGMCIRQYSINQDLIEVLDRTGNSYDFGNIENGTLRELLWDLDWYDFVTQLRPPESIAIDGGINLELWSVLQKQTAVRSLEFVKGKANDLLTKFVQQQTNLRELEFKFVDLSETGLDPIQNLTTLESLILIYSENCGSYGALTSLTNLQNLELLNVGDIANKPSEFRYVSKCHQLRSLNLSNIEVVHADFSLNDWPHLTRLGLGNMNLGDRELKEISQLTSLDLVTLINLPITSETIKQLSGLSLLDSLNLAKCRRIDDEAIPALAQLPVLNWLFIRETGITKKGVAMLAKSPSLEWLKLDGKQVGNEFVELLPKFPKLTSLDIELEDDEMIAWSKDDLIKIRPSLNVDFD